MARSMAQRLEVSERTVHKHLGNLYRKLDAHDRLLAVRRAEVLGLLPMAGPPTRVPEAARW
jgi:DNA-binding NarL/FixJ family response regulator